jgi:Xaa-Pro aminopeptidase
MVDHREHQDRLARFQSALASRGLAGSLVLPAVDVLYLTGTRQNGALWVPVAGAPVLLVRKSLARARQESAVPDVRPFPSSKELAGIFGASGQVGVAFDAVPAALLEWWRRQLPGAELVDASNVLRALRSVKSVAELAVMRNGAVRICGVLGEVPSFLRAGMRELDLSAEIEARLRRAGNQGAPRLRGFNSELFVGLAMAGESAAAPGYFDGPAVGPGLGPEYPQGAGWRPVGRDEPVLLDWTAVFDGYVLDMTRIAVVGALAPDLVRAFEVAREIQAKVQAALRPGAIPSEIWESAKAQAEAAGLCDQFMGPPGDQTRFVGHGVGLELDEWPVLAPGFKDPLQAGQTIAVEPKFVFPGRGVVGIENTFVVTAAGGEKLTAALPDEILQA